MFLKLLADSTRRAVCTRRAMTWGCHITCPLYILLLSGKMTSDLRFWIKTAPKHQKYSKFKQTWVRMFKVPPPVSEAVLEDAAVGAHLVFLLINIK